MIIFTDRETWPSAASLQALLTNLRRRPQDRDLPNRTAEPIVSMALQLLDFEAASEQRFHGLATKTALLVRTMQDKIARQDALIAELRAGFVPPAPDPAPAPLAPGMVAFPERDLRRIRTALTDVMRINGGHDFATEEQELAAQDRAGRYGSVRLYAGAVRRLIDRVLPQRGKVGVEPDDTAADESDETAARVLAA